MKRNNIIIAAAGLVVAGIVTYFLTRKKETVDESSLVENKAHHLTNAFSKAKEHALSHQ